MASPYDTPLYLLAFDHRSSFERGLFGATPPLSPEVRDGIAKAKEIIFEANRLAVASGAPRERAGVLVDEEFGSTVARRARREGVPLAMPVERSGRDEFDFQYGARFTEHIEAFDPTFVKVLVRFNPEGDPGCEPPPDRTVGPVERVAAEPGPHLPLRVARPTPPPPNSTASKDTSRTTTARCALGSWWRPSRRCTPVASSPISGRSRGSTPQKTPAPWSDRRVREGGTA